MQALISRAKADYAATASDNARLAVRHTTLVDAVSRIERSQAADFFSIAPGGSALDGSNDQANLRTSDVG
jgi:hypothetical protein